MNDITIDSKTQGEYDSLINKSKNHLTMSILDVDVISPNPDWVLVKQYFFSQKILNVIFYKSFDGKFKSIFSVTFLSYTRHY